MRHTCSYSGCNEVLAPGENRVVIELTNGERFDICEKHIRSLSYNYRTFFPKLTLEESKNLKEFDLLGYILKARSNMLSIKNSFDGLFNNSKNIKACSDTLPAAIGTVFTGPILNKLVVKPSKKQKNKIIEVMTNIVVSFPGHLGQVTERLSIDLKNPVCARLLKSIKENNRTGGEIKKLLNKIESVSDETVAQTMNLLDKTGLSRYFGFNEYMKGNIGWPPNVTIKK